MYFCLFLHFYQPYYQQDDILERVVNESYRPLMRIFLQHPHARATFNFAGALLQLLQEKGYDDVINSLKQLLDRRQIELTATAAYHPLLPLIPLTEARRQIELNEKIARHYLGDLYQPRGFFSPELAFDYPMAKLIKNMGYEWLLASELAYGPQPPWPDKTFVIKEVQPLKIFFRHKRASVIMLSAFVRLVKTLLEELEDLLDKNIYLVSVMDGETFGHHRPGMDDFLAQVFKEKPFPFLTLSEVPQHFPQTELVSPRPSTWSNEEQDFWLDQERKIVNEHPFLLWQDPGNPIHDLQWKFLHWVIELVHRKAANKGAVRELLDRALSSDQFWWASAKPWWSLEMIEAGAFRLREIVRQIPGINQREINRALLYYQQILEHAFAWQRSGKIRDAYRKAGDWKKIPFKKRAPADWYNQVILEFEDEMKKAVAKLEFEKAIKWRDAIIKLKKGHDIYDVFHVVDELHAVRKIPSLKPFRDHRPEEISEFARAHLINEEEKEKQIDD